MEENAPTKQMNPSTTAALGGNDDAGQSTLLPINPDARLALGPNDFHLIKVLDDGKEVALNGMRQVIYTPSNQQLTMVRCTISKQGLTVAETPKAFYLERAEIWSRFDHTNVLPFLGTTEYRDESYFLFPWLEGGNLEAFLQRARSADSSFDEGKLIREIASGLEYLHSAGWVHEQIRAANVLLNNEGCAVLRGFHRGKPVGSESVALEAGSGDSTSYRWVAPELLSRGSDQTPSAGDVYAFGMVIAENLEFYHEMFHIRSMRSF